MTKKRKFHYIYSNNTDEEEYQIRKDFTEMIRDMLVKNGKTIVKLVFLLTFIMVITIIYIEEIKQYFNYLFEVLNIGYYISIIYSKLDTKFGVIIMILLMTILLYQILTKSKWKK